MQHQPVRSAARPSRIVVALWLIGLLSMVVSCTDDESARSINRPEQWAGIDKLEQQLGPDAPVGRGIVIGHVESGDDNTSIQYVPNTNASPLDGVEFIHASGRSKFSGHADATARLIYGPTGLAPGISTVKLFQSVTDRQPSSDWLMQCLRVRRVLLDEMKPRQAKLIITDPSPPDPQGCDIFTHSWVRDGTLDCEQVLTRVDYLVDEFDTIVVAGVNNKGNSPVPPLLGSAFNVISVGTSGRRSSTGYTRLPAATPGRCKPDLVGHMHQTSFNTPVVAAVVARLLESARRMDLGHDHANNHHGTSHPPMLHAARAEVIKAVLLAGADKSIGFEPEKGRPLDPHHGAGAVRLDTSYSILETGPITRQALKQVDTGPAQGWNFEPIANHAVHVYPMTIAQPARELCVTITWHRRVKIHDRDNAMYFPGTRRMVLHPVTNQPIYMDTVRSADLNLAIVREDGEDADIVARSMSQVDNVEHIYLEAVPAGNYTFNVSRHDQHEETWDYAIAWRME